MYIWQCPKLNLWQEANLQRVKKGDMKASIHRMEIDRIRFVLSSYLRSRLQKVGKSRNLTHFDKTLLSLKTSWHNFDVRFSRLKSFSHMCWRKRSPDRWASRLCFHQRSLRLPKSEYSTVELQLLGRKCCVDRTDHLQVLQQHWDLPESCSAEEDATQPAGYGHAQSWWKSSIYNLVYVGNIALLQLRSLTVSVACSGAVPEPFLDSFVFLRVKETQENILVEPETDDQR